ncbi:MAG: transglycosylase domain-containing protein [Anaerolineales bacterium]
MTKIPLLIRSRMNRKNKNLGSLLGKAAFGFGLIFSLALLSFLVGLVLLYTRISQDLPSVEKLPVLLNPYHGQLMEPTRIYARDGEEVLWSFENPVVQKRDYAVLDLSEQALRSDIPPEMIKATLAATDPLFFSRPTPRISGLWSEEETIPRLLVSDLLLWQEPSGRWSEVREGILASQISTQYGREKVLEWYLNSVYYGNWAYGVASASEVYFGKPVYLLNLAEAVVLAAVSEAPALNPFDAPQAAKERQLDLLEKMVREDLISEEEGDRARKFKLEFNPEGKSSSQSPAFVEYVLRQLDDEIPRDRLKRGGFKIVSTIDGALQAQVQCSLQAGLMKYKGGESALSEECEAARLLPNYPGPILQDNELLHVDIVQLDPRNGQILAMVGRHPTGSHNLFTEHPPGTLLTPFIYLTSFAQGYEPAALVWDIPPENQDLEVEDLHPGCERDCVFHGPVSLRLAMANDYLVPALKFWKSLRPGNVENILSQLGIEIPNIPCSDCQMFPGSHGVDVLDIAQSFGVFGNQGVLWGWPSSERGESLEPVIVSRVEDLSGAVWRANPRLVSRAVISDQLAYMITDVLRDSEARRPSMGRQNVFEIDRPAAVKMGNTTQEGEIWTVGYTPQLVTAIWMGVEREGEGVSRAGLSKVASGYWRALTQSALKGQPLLDWELPDEMMTLEVCSPSGLLPTDHCPDIVREIFLQGNQPTQRDNLYQVLEVNRETNQLATVFTPSALIEERIYLNVPPEARKWAEEQGISTPPQQYDVSSQENQSLEVQISTPENFSFVKGEVDVKGAIPEEVLSYYIQFGQGLNPKTWQQIAQGSAEPRLGNTLGTWDTSQVENGLYALQLVVVREGQRVDKASTIVSVDNTPPIVSFSEEYEGRQYAYQPGKKILFQVQAVDEEHLEEVKFYLDQRFVASRKQPPFVLLWDVEIGTFTLKAKALDKAGNIDQQTVTFEVLP